MKEMIRILFSVIFVMLFFISCSTYPIKTYKLYEKKYDNLSYNSKIDSLEKKHNVKLHSLKNIELLGKKLLSITWNTFDSIRNNMSESEWFEYEMNAEIASNRIDNLLLPRINDIVKKQYKKKSGLVLTLGGNGYCGRQGKWYDDLTLKYGFKYKSILCSDLVFYEDQMATLYNRCAYKILDSLNGKDWEKRFADDILNKKKNIQIKTDFLSIYKTEEYVIWNKELLTFPDKVTKLRNLRSLHIIGNNFSEINTDLTSLEKLNGLYLDSNKLITFPLVVLDLLQLETLSLQNNEIVVVPDEICNLKNIRQLNLSNNNITNLPSCFIDMKTLRNLDITDNNLLEVPNVLYQMNFLEKLGIGLNAYEWKDNEEIKKQLILLQEALPNTKIY